MARSLSIGRTRRFPQRSRPVIWRRRVPRRPLPTGTERAQRAGEEESRRSPFVGGGARGRRRAAAMADESRPLRADMTPVAPAVIPLVHAPDDPGPNGDPAPEPATEAPPSEGWSRIRALFK